MVPGVCWEAMEGRGGVVEYGGVGQKSRERAVKGWQEKWRMNRGFERGGRQGRVWDIYIIGPCGLEGLVGLVLMALYVLK
nr:hypothetical protein [Tanacetum cinerariifolium]